MRTNAADAATINPNAASSTAKAILHTLSKRNLRITEPRKKVIDLISLYLVPFTAEEIYARLPEIGRATVYRTLKLLQDENIICKVVMPGDEMAYNFSLPPSDEIGFDDAEHHHHHAVCTVCGSIRAFTAETIERAMRTLTSSQDALGEIIDHRIEIYDICQQCKQKP